jgi:class 3 adenylate cyclase
MGEKEDVVRCYTKYIFLDVVQFSKRSAEAQSEIVPALNKIVLTILNQFKINSEESCILIPTGDGMCVALTSPDLPYDSHIQIALRILGSLEIYNNAARTEQREFEVRIGINQNTDILITDINGRSNIAGAGINLASRIMDKADGGQVLVSQVVFHELQPSEIYMDKFKGFAATGKHNTMFQVFQYIGGGHAGLNSSVPTAFRSRESKTEALSAETAYYFAEAIKHRQDLIRLKADRHTFWDNAAVFLLSILADDAYRLSKASQFGDEPMRHAVGDGKKNFDEQFAIYESCDNWVLWDAEAYIVNTKLMLCNHRDCFEQGEFDRAYAFISKKGVERLKTESPDIWDRYGFETGSS